MNLENVLDEIKAKTASFNASNYDGFLAVQVTLSDINKVFYVEVNNRKLSIEPYEYHDRQAHIIISADRFMKLINNKLNPVLAYTTGQLKVEGDMGKALELANLFKE